jgi:hypothetical protein
MFKTWNIKLQILFCILYYVMVYVLCTYLYNHECVKDGIETSVYNHVSFAMEG